MGYKSDIEIAQETEMLPVDEIAKTAGIDEKYLEHYGKYKAKIDYNLLRENEGKNGKLILVTAINPTPAGEGKTTTTVGLADGMRKLGKNVMVALREPSLGPVFRRKGRRCRWRIRSGCSHGRHQPAFHRRYARHRRSEQPAGCYA